MIINYANLKNFIYKALYVISNWSENISSPKAEAFKKYIVTVDFVVALYCLADVLAVTKPLNKAEAKKLIDETLDTLKQKKQNSEENFRSVLEEVRNLLEEIGVEFTMPRISNRMTNRANYQVTSAEDYYRISVQNQIMDEIILDLHRRFIPESLTNFDLNVFISSVLINLNVNDVSEKAVNVVSKYGRGFGEDAQQLLGSILGEFSIGKQHWLNESQNENKVPDNRLTGLDLLHIHKEMNIELESVLERFSRKKKRRIDIALV
nr:unnamed protein product [Callosobruchus analis]